MNDETLLLLSRWDVVLRDLDQTKEKIRQATRFALDHAGDARALLGRVAEQCAARQTQPECTALVYLVDSVLQAAAVRQERAFAAAAGEALLQRLGAAAGQCAAEACEKVAKTWAERAVLPAPAVETFRRAATAGRDPRLRGAGMAPPAAVGLTAQLGGAPEIAPLPDSVWPEAMTPGKFTRLAEDIRKAAKTKKFCHDTLAQRFAAKDLHPAAGKCAITKVDEAATARLVPSENARCPPRNNALFLRLWDEGLRRREPPGRPLDGPPRKAPRSSAPAQPVSQRFPPAPPKYYHHHK